MGKIFTLWESSSGKDSIWQTAGGESGAGLKRSCDLYHPSDPEMER